MKITITAQTGRPYASFVREQLKRAIGTPVARTPRPCLQQLDFVFVADREMKKLHHEFMNENTTTDVLTFPIDTTPAGNVLAGEVYVNVAEARRQAKDRGIQPRHEVLLYALHGMLHLLGYDDRTARDFHTMHAAEDEILTTLGLGPVFAPPSKKPAKRRAR